MKKFLRILGIVAAVAATVIILFCVILSSPAVQTAVARKVLDAIEKNMDGHFSFSSISIRPFDAIVVEDFALIDDNPYHDPEKPYLSKADTILSARSLSVSFNAIGLLKGNSAKVKDLRIKDGQFFLVNEPDGNNLKRVFSKNKPKQKKDPMKMPDIELMQADYVQIDGFRFRMINHRNPKPHRDKAMNWTDLDVSDIHMKARDISLKGVITEASVEHLDGREKSGYVINHLSGRARVYNRQTRIENLVMQDLWSDLHVPIFKMNYDRGIPSLNHFIEEVRLQAEVEPSRLNMESIAYFAPTLHRMDIVALLESASVDGYINDLKVTNFKFRTPDGAVSGEAEGELIGLPSATAMTTNYNVKNMSFTPEGIDKFVKGWAPGVKFDFSRFAKGERLTFGGTLRGRLSNARIAGTIKGRNVGTIKTNLQFGNLLESNKGITIDGKVETVNLDAGTILGTESLGPGTLHGTFKTKINDSGISVRIDSVRIDSFRALGYDYKDIVAAGTYSNDAFDGIVFSNDPNLSFMFNGLFTLSNKTGDGAYKFKLDLHYANLDALNIDKRGTSQLSLETDANFKTQKSGDILGRVMLKNITIKDNAGVHKIGDVDINSLMNNDVNIINLKSKFATLSYRGSRFVDGFIQDLLAISASEEMPSLLSTGAASGRGNKYSLDFKALDAKELISYIAPGLWVADGTSLHLDISKEGQLDGRLLSQRLAIGDKFLKDIDLSFNNKAGYLDCELYSSELKVSPIKTTDNTIKFAANNDDIGLIFAYDNKSEPQNKGTLSIGGRLGRDEDGKTTLTASLLDSKIILNDASWQLSSTPISLSSKGISLDKLYAQSEGQSLKIEGGWSTSRTDTLRLTMDNFNVAAVNPFLPQGLEAGGRITGKAMILSPSEGTPAMLANLGIADATLGDERLGTIKIGSMWDASRGGYKAICRNDLDGRRTLDFIGFISPKEKTAQARLNLDGFSMAGFAPLLSSVFSDLGGYVTGSVKASGVLGTQMDIQSDSLHINDGLLRVAFTNVPYKVDGDLSIDNDGVHFDKVDVLDKNGAKGRIAGGIGWKNFGDFNVNIGLEIDRMQVIDLEEDMNPAFYGKISASGNASLTGPFDAIMLRADAVTSGTGELHIPMNASGSMTRSDLLIFKEPEPAEEPDQYEEMLKIRKTKEQKINRFATMINVEANEGIEAFIEIDKASGNMLSGRGKGQIQLEARPSEGVLNLGGNFNVTDGIYHFAALGIAKRDFSIRDGSNVKFNGNVMDTDLDITAEYKTKTSLATLLSDTTTTSRRLVVCGISITDKIKSPRISFSIDVPDTDPTTRARVESALNTEDKLQKQFLSLLISGGFIPDDPSGIVNNSSMLGATVADIMASQLSNVLQKLNIPIDLGLDYQQTTSGADIFEVAVSTQLFNNRISINGTFGNRQSIATASQDVVGDIDVEFKVTRSGNIRATAFHHSADQYTNYLDNLKRNGLGISVQTEFDTVGELIQNLFPWLFKKTSRSEAIIENKEITVITIEEDD